MAVYRHRPHRDTFLRVRPTTPGTPCQPQIRSSFGTQLNVVQRDLGVRGIIDTLELLPLSSTQGSEHKRSCFEFCCRRGERACAQLVIRDLTFFLVSHVQANTTALQPADTTCFGHACRRYLCRPPKLTMNSESLEEDASLPLLHKHMSFPLSQRCVEEALTQRGIQGPGLPPKSGTTGRSRAYISAEDTDFTDSFAPALPVVRLWRACFAGSVLR